ncbi:MAG: hypothetical protein U5K28_04515 [Halobacteriales archaeon]|nr:hypothetical protein [Halobacteriales archaeon]
MTDQEAEAFTFDGGRVDPGETEEFRYPVSETYLGERASSVTGER